MKHLRVAALLIACVWLWGCQPASTGNLDKSAAIISVSGDPNAAIDCKTGRVLTSPAPADVGLGGASLEHRGDQAVVTLNFPRTADLAEAFAAANTPYFGGIGFIDPNLSLPHTNPNWYFDSAQNRGYKWFYDPGTRRFEGFATSFKDNKWTHAIESLASVTASGSNLILAFPWSEVAGSVWYVSATSPSVCTSLGLGADGKPNLPVPEGIVAGGATMVPTPQISTPAASTSTPPPPTRAAPKPTAPPDDLPPDDGY